MRVLKAISFLIICSFQAVLAASGETARELVAGLEVGERSSVSYEEVAVSSFEALTSVPELGWPELADEMRAVIALRKPLEGQPEVAAQLLMFRLTETVNAAVGYKIRQMELSEESLPDEDIDQNRRMLAELLRENAPDERQWIKPLLEEDSAITGYLESKGYGLGEVLDGSAFVRAPRRIGDIMASVEATWYFDLNNRQDATFRFLWALDLIQQARNLRLMADIFSEHGIPSDSEELKNLVVDRMSELPALRVERGRENTYGRVISSLTRYSKNSQPEYIGGVTMMLLPFLPPSTELPEIFDGMDEFTSPLSGAWSELIRGKTLSLADSDAVQPATEPQPGGERGRADAPEPQSETDTEGPSSQTGGQSASRNNQGDSPISPIVAIIGAIAVLVLLFLLFKFFRRDHSRK